MDGYRHSVISADGTRIGLLTAGQGPALMLVHGGMGCIESWRPLWPELAGRWRVTAMIAAGQPGRAMMSFLTEIIGLTEAQVSELRNAPRSYDVMPIVSATMPREGQAIADADLPALAAGVPVPVLLILGSASPAWARAIT